MAIYSLILNHIRDLRTENRLYVNVMEVYYIMPMAGKDRG